MKMLQRIDRKLTDIWNDPEWGFWLACTPLFTVAGLALLAGFYVILFGQS